MQLLPEELLFAKATALVRPISLLLDTSLLIIGMAPFPSPSLSTGASAIPGHPCRIVPNPVLGESFQLQIEGNPGVIDVDMYDLTGKLIFSFQNHDTDLPLEC